MPLLESSDAATPLVLVPQGNFASWLGRVPPERQGWIERSGFRGLAGQILAAPSSAGPEVLYGCGAALDRWSLGAAPGALPAGDYRVEGPLAPGDADDVALSWILGTYRFDTYRTEPPGLFARLCWPDGVHRARVQREAAAVTLVRNLVNTPANDMGPAELEAAAAKVAEAYGAQLTSIVGDDLLTAGFPLVHAVGRASSRPPRLIELRWGAADAPRLTVVGKGVCFDTGGLGLKTSDSMLLMKKDMGGAAHALALAQMVMDAGLDVHLRVLIPAVENAIGGDAMRPLDVVRSRQGYTVEIGHTDAEGRLILADALSAACDERPDVLIDFATLTSAARIALGPDIPALFSNDDALAREIEQAAGVLADPVWRLPLWDAYAGDMRGRAGDLLSVMPNNLGGAIYAALFLRNFVSREVSWAHLDIYAWNQKARPGRPEGGEAQTLRAVFKAVEDRFAANRRGIAQI